MVKYECECCNFTTKLKINFVRHQNTKKHKNNEEKQGFITTKNEIKFINILV